MLWDALNDPFEESLLGIGIGGSMVPDRLWDDSYIIM